MASRSQKIRLGIFVVISTFAFIALIAFFTSERYLRKTDTYYIAYKDASVSGLEVGSPVKYLGLKVGTIKDIIIDPEDVSRIIVKIAVQADTPIKKDAYADIVSLGITGLKMIEIRGASKDAPLLEEGGYIEAGSTEEITGKAEVIAEKMERVLTNLQQLTQRENLQKITEMIDNAAAAFEQIEIMLGENRQGLNQTIASAREITARMDTTSRLLQESAAKVRSIVYSDTVAQILSSTRDISLKLKEANLENLIKEFGKVIERTNGLLSQVDQDIERGSANFYTSMRQLQATLENLNQASLLIQEDPSVLLRGTHVSDAPDKHLEK